MSAPLINYQSGSTLFCTVNEPCNRQTDLNSRIICTELNLIDCGDRDCEIAVVNNGLYLCDCSESWNCNLCGNDQPYWNIVNPADKLYFQFQQIDNLNGQDPQLTPSFGWDSGFCFAQLYECCSDEEIQPDGQNISRFAENKFVGLYEQKDFKGVSSYFNIQQICFDVNLICELLGNQDKCFYFKFFFRTGNTIEFKFFDVICTEPFKCNPCPEKKTTVLIEGDFPNKDCFGYFYGTPIQSIGNVFDFINQYRVPAAFEQTGFEINKETVTRQLKAVSAETCEIWAFKTWGVPQKVAKIVANIFAAKNVYLNGDLFQLDKEIPKDNEIGSQWFIDTQFKRCQCYNDYSCE